MMMMGFCHVVVYDVPSSWLCMIGCMDINLKDIYMSYGIQWSNFVREINAEERDEFFT
jgi:hypothetical protein